MFKIIKENKDNEMKFLANKLGIKEIFTSDEHASDEKETDSRFINPNSEFYGYATIKTINFGEFIVSFSYNRSTKIPLDGFPWEFLKKRELTNNQKEFINNYNKELHNLILYVDNKNGDMRF